MKRLGFVRLGRYGLLLTPEGRIMSLRPAVLDDGLANRIVGWREDDLAAMELERWSPPPAPATAVASRVAISVMTLPAAPPAEVAREGQVEEDDWEWTIALARARAAAEDTETQLAGSPRPLAPVPPPIVPPTLPMIGTKLEPLETWPKTEPLGAIDYEDYSSARRDQPAAPPVPKVVRVPPPPAIAVAPTTRAPTTIIPVPKLSTVASAASLAPVRSTLPTPLSPRRLAKGTGSHDSKPAAVAVQAPALPRLPSIVQRSR